MNKDDENSKALLALSKEVLKEASRSRRQHNFRAIAFIVLFGSLFLYNIFSHKSDLKIPENEPYVSLIRINGTIEASSSASPRFLEPILNKAFMDQNSSGVLLVINSLVEHLFKAIFCINSSHS